MANWDGPSRGRALLTAALLTAICGMLFSWSDPTPILSATDAGTRPDLSRPASAGFSDSPSSSEVLDPDSLATTPLAGADEREELRDAVAASPRLPTGWSRGPAGTSGAWTAAARAAIAPPRIPTGWSRGRAEDILRRPPSTATPRSSLRRSRRPLASLEGSVAASSGSSASAQRLSSRGSFRSAMQGADGPETQRGKGASANASPAAPGTLGTAASTGGAPSSYRMNSGRPGSRLARLKPALIDKLLGPHPLHPPRGAIKPPARNPWKTQPPRPGISPMPLAQAELLAAPAVKARGALPVEHAGRGAWLEETGGKWWLWPSPDGPALLSHEGHWWWQSRGVWFLLHEGEPWGWRYLNEWRQEGLVHASGAQMLYSADGRRVGVVAPGEGAVLYDSATGAELGRWSAAELPQTRSLRAPTRLRLP